MFSLPRFARCALLLLLLPAALHAGDSETRGSRPGVLHLDIETAVRMALAKNFAIQVQEIEPQIAREQLTAEWGIFDPVLGLGGSRDYRSDRSRLDALGERDDRTFISRRDVVLDTGLRGRTPLGTDYRLGLSSIRNTSTGALFDDYSAGPTASIRQPLLRGFGPSATMLGIRIARTNVEISEWTLRSRVIDVITQLIYVYNDLYFAAENLAVATRSRELARQLLQDNTRRAAIGVMSPLDVTTARADVAAREEGVILALRTRKDNETLLKQLVTAEMEPMLAIGVEIEPPRFLLTPVNVHTGIREALEYRPDYRSQLLNIKNRHVTIAFARNQLLPQLDLAASLGFLGFDREFASSLSRASRPDVLTWSAGATFSIPLGNHAARGSFNAARLDAAQALIELKRIEQQIVADVDLAAGQVVTGRARIASTTESSVLAKESLEAGEQRLRAGTGTTFEVLQLQERLAAAESAELRARSDHNKAVAEFFRKTGRTLRVHGVELD
jgi:outer membrane protein